MLEILEILVDTAIMVLSAAVTWRFWKTFRKLGGVRNAALAFVFLLIFGVKASDIFFINVVGRQDFEWVHSHYVFNSLWLLMLIAIYTSLSRPRA